MKKYIYFLIKILTSFIIEEAATAEDSDAFQTDMKAGTSFIEEGEIITVIIVQEEIRNWNCYYFTVIATIDSS